MPTREDWRGRLDSVLHVLYLIFSEGYASSRSDEIVRTDLSQEAIRLTRVVHRMLPDEPEVAGLLALMLLTDARRTARIGRVRRADPAARAGPRPVGRGCHRGGRGTGQRGAQARPAGGRTRCRRRSRRSTTRRGTRTETDWPQILALYGVLERIQDNPMVTLNRAVALAMVDGPRAGLELLDTLDDRLPGHYRLAAVRGHLLTMAGDRAAAVTHLRAAANGTSSTAEQRYLLTEIARLNGAE